MSRGTEQTFSQKAWTLPKEREKVLNLITNLKRECFTQHLCLENFPDRGALADYRPCSHRESDMTQQPLHNQGKCKLGRYEVSSHTVEDVDPQEDKITNIERIQRKGDFSLWTTCGIVSWCSHYRAQYWKRLEKIKWRPWSTSPAPGLSSTEDED